MVKITNKTRRTTFTTTSTTSTSLRIFFRSHLNKCICISPFILLSFVIFVIVIILKLQYEHKLIIKQQQQYHYDNIIDNDVVNIHNHIISNNHIISSNDEQKIINGELHLINLDKPTFYHMDNKTTSTTTTNNNNNNNNNNQRPYSVIGTFCHLDWTLHKENPSNVPMNKDLIHKSKKCHGTSMIQMDVYDIVQKMKQFDLVSSSSTTSSLSSSLHTMEPTGFVFHESRCGSTLVANSLASYNPETNRVYSESNPPITAAKAFNEQYEESSLQLLRDVIYLMGKI